MFFKTAKNQVLDQIRRSSKYGHLCLGLEFDLAGSAEFQPPKFSNIKYLPNITPKMLLYIPYIVIDLFLFL